MNTDIRLSVGFWDHPKTKKTVKRLGLDGVRSLQILWLWVAANRPDGSLFGMDWEDIELAADWRGGEREFFDVCLGRWIDEAPDGFMVHDWQEHNPWQAEAEARSEKARNAAKAKWRNARALNEQCSNDAQAMPEQCLSSATALNEQCPSPLLSSPKHISTREDKGTPLTPQKGGDVDGLPDDFTRFWDAYPKKTGKQAALRAYRNAKNKPPIAELLAILGKQKLWAQWQRDGGQYIPNPATWLNQGRWADEPPEALARASPPGALQPGMSSTLQRNMETAERVMRQRSMRNAAE